MPAGAGSCDVLTVTPSVYNLDPLFYKESDQISHRRLTPDLLQMWALIHFSKSGGNRAVYLFQDGRDQVNVYVFYTVENDADYIGFWSATMHYTALCCSDKSCGSA